MEDKTKTEDQHQIKDETKIEAQAEIPVNQAETVSHAETPVNKVGNDRTWLSRSTRWNLFVRNRLPGYTQAGTLVIGIAAVLISLATLLVVAGQAWIYNEQRKLMAEQTKLTAEQTKLTAEQMDLTKKSERAYVGVDSLDANLKDGSVVIRLQNAGRIPATEITVQLFETRHQGDKSLGSLKPESYETQQIFGTFKMQIPLKLDRFQPSEVENIMAKRETLYVHVTIQYYNGFEMAETKSTHQFVGPQSNNWVVVPD